MVLHYLNGEGNGNPLQCSCLENPRDRGAWWAAVYGVTQSWTRLKRLSSSSSSNGKLCIFCWMILDTSLSAVFIWSNLEQYLLGNNCLVFQKELIIEDSLPIPEYTHHFCIKTGLGLVGDDSVLLPYNLFFSTLLHSMHLSLPVTMCFKNGIFSLCLENHVWKYSQVAYFFGLTHVEPKHQSN